MRVFISVSSTKQYQTQEHAEQENSRLTATWQNQQNKCAPSEHSDQPGHPPSLIRVFAVCIRKHWVLSYPLSAQRGLWSDWADALADLSLSLLGTHLFCWFCHEAAQMSHLKKKRLKRWCNFVIFQTVETPMCIHPVGPDLWLFFWNFL